MTSDRTPGLPIDWDTVVFGKPYTDAEAARVLSELPEVDEVKTYTVRPVRSKHGWELHIDGVGVTQVDDLEQARAAARDYIEAMTGETDFAITIEEQTWPA